MPRLILRVVALMLVLLGAAMLDHPAGSSQSGTPAASAATIAQAAPVPGDGEHQSCPPSDTHQAHLCATAGARPQPHLPVDPIAAALPADPGTGDTERAPTCSPAPKGTLVLRSLTCVHRT
jgi:hypothetical protein